MKKMLLSLCSSFFLLFGMHADDVALFAGGCFWCMQHDFDQVKGVTSTTAGYTGGTKVDPTYEEVSEGGTGHVEAVQVTYNPSKVSYEQLLDFYFHNIDPTRSDGQFCDKGNEYRPVIFYENDSQKKQAEKYKLALINSKKWSPYSSIFCQPKPFTLQRSTIRNLVRKIPFGIDFTARIVGGING